MLYTLCEKKCFKCNCFAGFSLCSGHRQVCSHERSWRPRNVLYPSTIHISTGSTVNTFMSQDDLAECYEQQDEHETKSLARVPEEEEEDDDDYLYQNNHHHHHHHHASGS